MRVALISPAYPQPKAGFFPGVERYACELSKALVKKGVEVKLITSYWNGGVQHESLDGLEIYRIRDLSVKLGRLGRLFDLHYYTLGKNIFKRCKGIILSSDIVHTLMPLSCAKEVRKLKPLVSHFHHPVGVERLTDILHIPFHHQIERLTYTNSDRVIAQSKYGGKKVSEMFGIDESKIEVCYCGVDTEKFSPKKRLTSGDCINLLFVGVLEKRKGVEHLLYALKLVLKRCDKVKLTIVGKGPEEMKLKKLSKELVVASHIGFKGFVDEEQLLAHYNSADIFTFPSLVEGFGMVLAEAMACGLPVIASNVSATPEVLGDAGILVKPSDPKAIADAIVKLIRDEDLRMGLRMKARRRVREKFTWDRVAEAVIKAYGRACVR